MMWRLYYSLLRLVNPVARHVFRVLNMLTGQQRAKVLLINGQGEILLVQNTLGDRRWTLPGGGIEKGESANDAAIREVHEELGIVLRSNNCRHIGQVYVAVGRYDAPIIVSRLSEVQKSSIKPRKLEIYAAEWFSVSKLPEDTQPIVIEAYALLSPEGSIDTII